MLKDGRTDDRRKVITIAHPDSTGELKTDHRTCDVTNSTQQNYNGTKRFFRTMVNENSFYKMTDGKRNWQQRSTNVTELTQHNYYWYNVFYIEQLLME